MTARHHDTVTDAGMRAWVCEKGHVDDHHYDMEPQRCSRCGGSCRLFSLDALAGQLATLRSEAAYVRGHLESYASSIVALKDSEGRSSVNADDFATALREDSRRLGKLGGGADV